MEVIKATRKVKINTTVKSKLKKVVITRKNNTIITKQVRLSKIPLFIGTTNR